VGFATRGLADWLQPYADWCLQEARAEGLTITVTSVNRDFQTQARLRRQYEACLARGERVWPGNPDPRCRYPANRPGDSAHEQGLAFDSSAPPAQMDRWIEIRRAAGWIVPAADPIHAEVPNWRAWTT
jgi:D-alanyl-D-alanine carboxypeptidase